MTGGSDGWCQMPRMLRSMCLSALPALHPLLQHQLRTRVHFQYLLLLSFCEVHGNSLITLVCAALCLQREATPTGKPRPRGNGVGGIILLFPIYSIDVSEAHSTQLFRDQSGTEPPCPQR